MASSKSIAAVALSLTEMLNRSFIDLNTLDSDAFRALPTARLVQSDDFGEGAAAASPVRPPALAVFCYRVDVNRTMRAPWSAVAHHDGNIHLPLDIHFLLTPFDTDAEGELRILGATMQCMELNPILSGPLLHPHGDWSAGESIQFINEDLVTEDVLRTFDTLPTHFRLSVSYMARVARIDAPAEVEHPDVTMAIRGLVPSAVAVP